MNDSLRDELKAEYTILQTQYEAFDGRALMIKSWSAPLLAGGVGLGVNNRSVAIIVALIVAAICLWALEAIWKAFQYCYTDRIKRIEAWFHNPRSQEISPFQTKVIGSSARISAKFRKLFFGSWVLPAQQKPCGGQPAARPPEPRDGNWP
jgi:hypothetical protein